MQVSEVRGNNALVQWLPVENGFLQIFCEPPYTSQKFNGKHYWQSLIWTHQKIMDHLQQLGSLRNTIIKIFFVTHKYHIHKLNNIAHNFRGLILWKNMLIWNSALCRRLLTSLSSHLGSYTGWRIYASNS